MNQTSDCGWCLDGEPTWEDCERYVNTGQVDFLHEAMQRLWFDYSQNYCPRTQMRHVPPGTPYPGLIDP